MTTFITRTLFKTIPTILNASKATVRHGSSKTYKAAVFNSKEAKELCIEELKKPSLKDTEVRIQVAYCSINIFDVLNFSGDKRKYPYVPGYEFSGEIIEAGKEANQLFNKDDRVIALTYSSSGGLATECVVDMKNIWTIPTEIQLKDAAVIPYSYSLALYTFGVLADLKEFNNVVVSVGTAGIGLTAVEVAANIYKAKVIAVTDTEVNSELTREKGAFSTMHYKDKIQKQVLTAFENKRADVVFDAVGGDVYDALVPCVSHNGKIFTPIIGKVNTPPPHASLTTLSLEQLMLHNLNGYRQVVQDSLELAKEGMITPHISEKFSFKDVNDAVNYVKSKQCTGKVVVKVD